MKKVVVGKEATAATKQTSEGTYGLIEHTPNGWRATVITITTDDVSRKTVDLWCLPERRQLESAFAVAGRASEIFLVRGEDEAAALSLIISRGIGHPHFCINYLKRNETIAVPPEFLDEEQLLGRMKEPEEEPAYV